MTQWIIDPSIREEGRRGIEWARGYLGGYDLSTLDWVRIDRGRQNRNGRAPQGVYGRHWLPTGRGKARKGSRISCQVPGPFPHTLLIRTSPAYVTLTRYYGDRPSHVLDAAGSQVMQLGQENGVPFWDVASEPPPANWSGGFGIGQRDGRAWWRTNGSTTVDTIDEAIAWIIGHEAFHFLRKTRQVPGINNEIQADAAGDAALAAFRAEGEAS